MSLLQYKKDQWVSVIDCHLCKKQTLTKETHIITLDYLDYEYFGIKGFIYVSICHRDDQLNELFKNENTE